jgi:transglutaminase-like putative cysteine protease
MQYLVRHLTRFVYTSPVSESVMELRMQPLELDRQHCLRFSVSTSPRARVFAYHDHFGNAVHYFDIPAHHTKLDVTIESAVETTEAPDLPDTLPADAWAEVDEMAKSPDHLDWLLPSEFTTPTPLLQEFSEAIGFKRGPDPLTTLKELNTTLFNAFAYEPKSTRVDSLMDEALRSRAGVCQDFSHIMTALVRGIGIPCRYVSGYIAPRESHHDRAGDNSTHAWIEAFLPGLGVTVLAGVLFVVREPRRRVHFEAVVLFQVFAQGKKHLHAIMVHDRQLSFVFRVSPGNDLPVPDAKSSV